MSKKTKLFSLICLVFISSIISSNVFAQNERSEALRKINEAEDFVKNAYLSLIDIERAGADITELIAQQNTALEYFFEANRVFEEENYALAITFADRAIDEAEVILKTDIGMIFLTELFQARSYRNQLILSIGISGIILLFTIISWRVFKNYYLQNTLV